MGTECLHVTVMVMGAGHFQISRFQKLPKTGGTLTVGIVGELEFLGI